MLQNKAEGARHLSSNSYVHRFNEGPAEKLDGYLADYMAHEEDWTASQLQTWINKNSKANSKLGQIFNHQETRDYLKAQFRPHFNVDDYFSITFCIDKLHKWNGAVSNIITIDEQV